MFQGQPSLSVTRHPVFLRRAAGRQRKFPCRMTSKRRLDQKNGPAIKRFVYNSRFGAQLVVGSKKVQIDLPNEMFLPSLKVARRMISCIHQDLKHTLFSSLRLSYGSPKPPALCTSTSFLKDQGAALDLRYVWDPVRSTLQLLGDFQVELTPNKKSTWDVAQRPFDPAVYADVLQERTKKEPSKPNPLTKQPSFVHEVIRQPGSTKVVLELPDKLDLPSYSHAIGIIKAIHKQLKREDATLKIKYDVERAAANSQIRCRSKGELGILRYYWRKTGAGPAGQLSFSENFVSLWPEGKPFTVDEYPSLRLKVDKPAPPAVPLKQPAAEPTIQVVLPSSLSYLAGFAK
jgi:hypothetical protein